MTGEVGTPGYKAPEVIFLISISTNLKNKIDKTFGEGEELKNVIPFSKKISLFFPVTPPPYGLASGSGKAPR